jgi:GH15 family glucan-1,4-alpha-glucosidase
VKSQTSSLELAVIGNSRIGALIDTRASVVWMCVPRFDGDPVFCALLDDDSDQGRFDIELQDCVSITQAYERNTAIVRTELADSSGARLEIVDFAPRFHQHGRMFAPVSIVRIVHRLAGRPRIRVRFAPRCDYGAAMPAMTFGSHHIRADVPAYRLRLTTDAPITHVIESRSLLVEGNLAVPFEWQEEVIRAAITLKLNTFDDTGGIVAALTTSVPEAPHTQRTWDYRYCWLRDAYFVINALNRLGATDSLERYLHYIENIVADAQAGSLQPVYALNGTAELGETIAAALSGYRRMGPVRVGNLAFIQAQNDVYGSAILA